MDKMLVGGVAGVGGLLVGTILGRATADAPFVVFVGQDWEAAEKVLYGQGLDPMRYGTPVWGDGFSNMLTPAVVIAVPQSQASKARTLLLDWKQGRPLPNSVRSMLSQSKS